MRALADDGLSAFSPASTAGRSQHCLGGALQEAPSSPSLASNMNPTSCRTLPDLAPGTCSVEASEAICFPPLLRGNQPLPPCLGTTVSKRSQDSEGTGPLSTLLEPSPHVHSEKSPSFAKIGGPSQALRVACLAQ